MNNITQILKKLDISWVKIGLLLLLRRKDALYEYFLDKANTAVNMAVDGIGGADTFISVIVPNLIAFSNSLKNYYNYLPKDWIPYAIDCNNCLLSVYKTFEDGKASIDEIKDCIAKFQIAYSRYKAD